MLYLGHWTQDFGAAGVFADEYGPGNRKASFLLESSIKTVNLKSDRPSVVEALQRLDREIALAGKESRSFLKVIHGYGSTGEGGDIRIAAQKRLQEMANESQISGCIFGENWSKADAQTWQLVQRDGELKSDPDLGRGNRGITIVLLKKG